MLFLEGSKSQTLVVVITPRLFGHIAKRPHVGLPYLQICENGASKQHKPKAPHLYAQRHPLWPMAASVVKDYTRRSRPRILVYLQSYMLSTL